MLAPVVALAAISPVVVTAFLGLNSIYPVECFPEEVWVFWSAVAAVAVLVWLPVLLERSGGPSRMNPRATWSISRPSPP